MHEFAVRCRFWDFCAAAIALHFECVLFLCGVALLANPMLLELAEYKILLAFFGTIANKRVRDTSRISACKPRHEIFGVAAHAYPSFRLQYRQRQHCRSKKK